MSLEQTLKKVAGRLRSGRLENAKEARIRSNVIDPVLSVLDWDTSDDESVCVEYTVNNGSVDYALLNDGQPLVFIEAKKVGALDAGSEGQLFGYANNQRIPLLILTDGNIWDFYLSMAPGVPKERRFHQLELSLEDRITDHVDFLENYLRRNCVVSDQAIQRAWKMRATNPERKKARMAIPGAYQVLLRKPDDTLCDLLSKVVKDACDIQPNLDDVRAFLKQRSLLSSPAAPKRYSPKPSPAGLAKPPSKPTVMPSHGRRKLEGYVLHDETFEVKSNIQVLIELVKTFHGRDSEFMKRFYLETAFKTRRLVAQNPDDLYDNEAVRRRGEYVNLGNGWWLGTNINTERIVRFIKIACRVANVKFDADLKLIERK